MKRLMSILLTLALLGSGTALAADQEAPEPAPIPEWAFGVLADG